MSQTMNTETLSVTEKSLPDSTHDGHVATMAVTQLYLLKSL